MMAPPFLARAGSSSILRAAACAATKAARTLRSSMRIEMRVADIDERLREVGAGIVDEDVEAAEPRHDGAQLVGPRDIADGNGARRPVPRCGQPPERAPACGGR